MEYSETCTSVTFPFSLALIKSKTSLRQSKPNSQTYALGRSLAAPATLFLDLRPLRRRCAFLFPLDWEFAVPDGSRRYDCFIFHRMRYFKLGGFAESKGAHRNRGCRQYRSGKWCQQYGCYLEYVEYQ